MIDHEHYSEIKNKKLSDVIDNPMITTKDNPYNPFTDFDRWFKEDCRLGHNTCSVLDSLSYTSELIFGSDKNDEIINNAMKRIIEIDILNNFIIVSNNDYENNLLKNYKKD